VRIVGNKAFSESTLKGLFDQDTGGWLSWYTKSDRYSRAKLNADLETLRSYYLQRGYLEFRVDSTQVAISPDKQEITITVNVTEGERFVVSSVKLEGNYLERDEEFKSLVTIRAGEPYNVDQVTETTKAFSEHFGNFGFAFARIEAVPEIDRETNRVALVLQADPVRRAYVRRIHVAGNNRTRDEVVRREFRQFESSWYDGERIRLSRDRVDRLGFFTEVNVETQEVPGAPDQVDLVINVAEKPTGSLQLGAGFRALKSCRSPLPSSRRTSLARATTWGWMSTPANSSAHWCSAPPIRISPRTAFRARWICTTALTNPMKTRAATTNS